MLPNRGSPLNGPYPTKSLLVTAPTEIPNDEIPGMPMVPYPCPEFPALDIIVVPV